MSKAEGKAEVRPQIFSKNKCVKVIYGQLMLTQKLQRRFAEEEEAIINTRMGTKQVLEELAVGDFFQSVIADTFVAFGSREFAVRIGCRCKRN